MKTTVLDREKLQFKTVDELEQIRESYLAEHCRAKASFQKAKRAYEDWNSEIREINRVLDAKRAKHLFDGKMRISEHALVRYLERHVGIDVEKHRTDLRTKAEIAIKTMAKCPALETETWKLKIDDGLELWIRGGTLTTTFQKE